MQTNPRSPAWPAALQDNITKLAEAYCRRFRREAEQYLRPQFLDVEKAVFDGLVESAARRSWAEFEREELPGLLAELRDECRRPRLPHE